MEHTLPDVITDIIKIYSVYLCLDECNLPSSLKCKRTEKKKGMKSETAAVSRKRRRGGQVPLSWVPRHGNMRRGRGMQREGTRPTTSREQFTSGEEPRREHSDSEKRGRRGQGERMRGVRKRREMEVQPPSSHRSITF